MTPVSDESRRDEEETLLLEFYAGNRQSFDRFFKLVTPWLVHRSAHYMTSRAECVDLADDVMARLYLAATRGVYWNPERGRLREYLARMVANLARDEARALRRSRRRFKQGVGEVDRLADSRDPADDETTLSVYTLALFLLPPAQRLLVLRRYGERRPLKEVARELRKSTPAISRLHNAVKDRVRVIASKIEAIREALTDDEAEYIVQLAVSEEGAFGEPGQLKPSPSARRILAKLAALLVAAPKDNHPAPLDDFRERAGC